MDGMPPIAVARAVSAVMAVTAELKAATVGARALTDPTTFASMFSYSIRAVYPSRLLATGSWGTPATSYAVQLHGLPEMTPETRVLKVVMSAIGVVSSRTAVLVILCWTKSPISFLSRPIPGL